MRIQEAGILSSDQKVQITDLWNKTFPLSIGLDGIPGLEQYLSELQDHHHLLLIDDKGIVQGWFFDFIREEERWFTVMLSPGVHGKGWGSQLMRQGMAANERLNGWVVNTFDYKTQDGQTYQPPVGFYQKLGFEIHPDIRLELPQINCIKITWYKKKNLLQMNSTKIQIRPSTPDDFQTILDIQQEAFGSDEVANLVAGLLSDESAEPIVSLLALVDDQPAGYILYTRATIEGLDQQPLMHILAPLAVRPEFQKQGIGGKLIEQGFEHLKAIGTELVFVLGHETYYPKFGFIPDAGRLGFPATYPIPEVNANAWMVYPLREGTLDSVKGKVICADHMNSPEHWRE